MYIQALASETNLGYACKVREMYNNLNSLGKIGPFPLRLAHCRDEQGRIFYTSPAYDPALIIEKDYSGTDNI